MINELKNFKKLYKQLLEIDAKNYVNDIYPFFIQVGKEYYNDNKRCLFIGKSVNGWVTNSRNVEKLFDQKYEDKIVNRHDQVKWVSDLESSNEIYNTKKSSFWRVIKRVALEYCKKEDWYNYIAWSNLYKLSPKKGNPNAFLQNIQKETGIKILNEEIKVLKPKYIIYLTSGWEKFYLDSIGLNFKNNKKISWDGYNTYYQEFKDVNFIQSKHPQGKNEDLHVQAILKILNKNK